VDSVVRGDLINAGQGLRDAIGLVDARDAAPGGLTGFAHGEQAEQEDDESLRSLLAACRVGRPLLDDARESLTGRPRPGRIVWLLYSARYGRLAPVQFPNALSLDNGVTSGQGSGVGL
jgi:hypothetical protein